MGKDVIIACDFASKEQTLDFLKNFTLEKPYVKIGMELFFAEGPDIVKIIKDLGHKVFLDLKLCDIPKTVKNAMRSLSVLGADMLNVHAFGTVDMMKAAVEGAVRADGSRPKIIAVTLLTSVSEETVNKELMINSSMEKAVAQYAANAKSAGMDGVVCSPLEAAKVKKECGNEFLTVTPGVRFALSDAQDQKRVTTPDDAKALGSDYIVMGRPITKAANPLQAYRRALNEFVD